MTDKLKLQIDQLEVESFNTAAAERDERGTVDGFDSDTYETKYDYTCRGYGTCGIYPCKPVP
jgi:hypothetical protein